MKKIVSTMLKIYNNNKQMAYQKYISFSFQSASFFVLLMTLGSFAINYGMMHHDMYQYYNSETHSISPGLLVLLMGVLTYYIINAIGLIICGIDILQGIKDLWLATIGKIITKVKYQYYKNKSAKIKAEIMVNYKDLIAEAKKNNCEESFVKLMNGLSINQKLSSYDLDEYAIKRLKKIGIHVNESEDVFSDVTFNNLNIHSDDGSHTRVVDENINFFQQNSSK